MGQSNLPQITTGITGNPLEFKSLKYEEDVSNQGRIGEIINNPIIKWIFEHIIEIFVIIIAGLGFAWIKPRIFK